MQGGSCMLSLHFNIYLHTCMIIISLLHHFATCTGFEYLHPPPLPSNYIDRQSLLDEIAVKLLQVNNDPNKYETAVTITGAGGFGKTTTVISLCYYPIVHKQFTDGFLFIELGSQATDASVKLRAIYNLLTDQQCKINVVEQKVNQLTWEYYRNLLVIIDDVWHVEDAEPLVKAFSNCKIILTTRMKDIEQFIPSQTSVTIGPMIMSEAISLLTNGIIDNSQLLPEDMSLLNELAQDVYLWPLLLSLVRGQLSHNLKQFHLSYHEAIQNLQTKLHHKGLTAFDKKTIATIRKSRKLAVKACIEMTLELLTKSLSDKIKILILWTGIGTSLSIAVLNKLWNISKQEAEESVDALWAYGLVQFTDIIISPKNIKQHCVEVHAIISQYFIECIDSEEVATLSPFGTLNTALSVEKGLTLTFQQSYGVNDLSSLTAVDCLKYNLSKIENVMLPYYLKSINMLAVNDPHHVILMLRKIKEAIMSSPYIMSLLSLLDDQINSLQGECKQIIKNVNKLCRKLSQSVQRNLCEQKYDKLIQTLEEFIKNYPLCILAQKAATIMKRIIPYCDGELLAFVTINFEQLQRKTSDYHLIPTFILPCIKVFIKQHNKITSLLHNGSPDIEMTYHYFWYGKFIEELELVRNNYLIKLQEVAPNFVQQTTSQQ